MNIDDMIAVLEAAKRGEEIQWLNLSDDMWVTWKHKVFNFADYTYRIAPKKEMTLVDELRTYADQVGRHGDLFISAADRITELEEILHHNLDRIDNDLLMTLLKKRLRK